MNKPGNNNHRKLLLGLAAFSLVSGCAMQSYQSRPIAPASISAEFHQRSLDSADLRAYMVAQGYPENNLPVQQWGLRELMLAALFFHPQLEVARAQWHAAQAAETTAGHKPNPSISGSAEHHSKTSGGISPWTLSLGLGIPIETGGKRQARIDQATALSEAARIEIGQSAWQIRSRLSSSLLDYQAAMQQAELLQHEVAIRSEIVQMLQKRLDVGMVSDIDLSQTRLLQQKAQQTLQTEAGRTPELRAAIAAAAGLPAQALDKAQLASSPIDAVPSASLPGEEIQRAALLNRLDIRSALSRYTFTEARLQLEIAKQYPDITLGPGYSFDQGDNRWSLGLSLILALLNKNEGPIAEARAQREAEASQFYALQTRVIGQQEQALARYRAALEEAAKAKQLVAAQQQRIAQTERQFEAGYTDRLELTTTRLELLSAQQGVLAASIKVQRAKAALEDAMQRPLDGDESWTVNRDTANIEQNVKPAISRGESTP